jgi:hypothetical protein
MEERGSAHRMTQRHLGESPEDESPEDRPSAEAPEAVPSTTGPAGTPVIPSPPGPRVPSDLELRKRQRAWQRERARFEASRRASAPPADASK